MQKAKPTEGHFTFLASFSFLSSCALLLLFHLSLFYFSLHRTGSQISTLQIGTIIEKFFLPVLFFWGEIVHRLFSFFWQKMKKWICSIICSINARGLGYRFKWQEVFNWQHRKQIAIFFIQWGHCTEINMHYRPGGWGHLAHFSSCSSKRQVLLY